MRKYVIFILLLKSNFLFAQDYLDILRAGDFNNLVNPGYSVLEGNNSIKIKDSRFLSNNNYKYNLSLISLGISFDHSKSSVRDSLGNLIYRKQSHKGLSLDFSNYGDDIYTRNSIGLGFSIKKQLSRKYSLLYTLKFSLISDYAELINFNENDPIYISWLNKNQRQVSSSFNPSLIFLSKELLIGLSYHRNLQLNNQINIFGNSLIFTGKYSYLINSNSLDFNFNYVLLNNNLNISSIMFNLKFRENQRFILGERNFNELYLGYGINILDFNVDLIYNFTISNKSIKEINVYSLGFQYYLNNKWLGLTSYIK